MPRLSIKFNDRDWKWLCLLGIVFVVLSFVCLSKVIKVTMISVFFVGIIFLIAGIAQILDVFGSKKWEVSLWHGLAAVIYFAIGCLTVADPLLATTVITLIIGISLVIIGIFRLIMALSLRGHTPGWFLLMFNSIVAIVMGLIIIATWPTSSLWLIGLIITIELMISGWTYILLALTMRKHNL